MVTMKKLLFSTLLAIFAFPALAASAVGDCALYAGAGTGKVLATGKVLDECVKAATTPGAYTVKTPVTVAADPVSITVTGLPDATTTVRTASIGYTSLGVIWCRLDNYSPVACKNPFVLGSAAPLAVGPHRVDFYAAADLTKPLFSHSWTITGATPPPPPPPPPIDPNAKALATLKSVSGNPGFEGVSGSGKIDVAYTGQTFTGSDGLVRIRTNDDGTTECRTVQGDEKLWSGNRCELGWSGKMAMNPGADYWFAFAFKPLAWGGGRQIFWQVHQDSGTQPSGCNGPTLELQLANGALQINSTTGSSSVWTCNPLLNSTAFAPAIGKWSRFVVHFRPGYLASQSPMTQVWKDDVLVYASTNINTQPSANDYPKYGIYKWDDAWSGVNQRAAQFSPLFYGQGADLKANADASVAGFK